MQAKRCVPRRDWPEGSNAAVLARQARSASGYTERVASPRQAPPFVIETAPLSADAEALYAFLVDLAESNVPLPPNWKIAQALNWFEDEVARAFGALYDAGRVERFGSFRWRDLKLQSGARLHTLPRAVA